MADKQQFIEFFESMGIKFAEVEPFEAGPVVKETSYISVGQTHFYFEDDEYTHLMWDEMGIIEKRGEVTSDN